MPSNNLLAPENRVHFVRIETEAVILCDYAKLFMRLPVWNKMQTSCDDCVPVQTLQNETSQRHYTKLITCFTWPRRKGCRHTSVGINDVTTTS